MKTLVLILLSGVVGFGGGWLSASHEPGNDSSEQVASIGRVEVSALEGYSDLNDEERGIVLAFTLISTNDRSDKDEMRVFEAVHNEYRERCVYRYSPVTRNEFCNVFDEANRYVNNLETEQRQNKRQALIQNWLVTK